MLAPMALFEWRHWWSLALTMAPMVNFVSGANDAIVCAIDAIADCLAPMDNFVNGANDAIVCAIDAIPDCLAPMDNYVNGANDAIVCAIEPLLIACRLAPADLIGSKSNVIVCHYRQWRHSNVVR